MLHDDDVCQLAAEMFVIALRKRVFLYYLRCRAFKEDGVAILEIGEDVWGLGEFFHVNIEELVAAFEAAHR